ncbi:MAG: PHP domain-containing protein, partial [Candidatus Cloacimonadota bacterium]|nr:PHP domain-containing protein [Candidatus Cloacimonadota bacterium]
ANMEEIGMKIRWKELVEEAKGEIIGRPHFAKLMVKKGFVEDFQQAFDKYLAKGKPLYLNKKRLDPDKAIELILSAGGIPVMAHPFQTKLVGAELEAMIKQLKEYGLQGIETFYSTHTQEQIDFCLQMAEKYNLLITAGSDFHGANKPIELGMNVDEKYLIPFLEKVGK